MEQSTLAVYTRPGLIVPELRERDAAGIISELSHVLQRDGCVPDVLPFYHTALNHELMANSALPCGIALPHGRLNGVKQLQFALGRTPEPVTWGSKGSCRVQLVFLLAVPATNAASYLHLLASLARLGQQPDQLTEHRSAENTHALLAVLSKIKLRP
ncbi:MAG TPA: PTS sugar transporter subunit IIA [Patescibacteria group bacterium]|nr:PTS sugar transporter subunit IIA [Patescibacteria group bacterium]